MQLEELEQRLLAMEAKCAYLEETLNTLAAMIKSEQMKDYIEKRQHSMKFASLLNALADEPAIDTAQQQQELDVMIAEKERLDNSISQLNTQVQPVNHPAGYIPYTLEYKPYKHGVMVTAYSFEGFDSDEEIVTVPDSYNGLPVIKINDEAFANSGVKRVFLPQCLEEIGSSAFFSCSSLERISLPDGLTAIGDSAFANCRSLAKINLPESLKIMGAAAFSHCISLASVTIPPQITGIRSQCFEHCFNLTRITLNNTLTVISDYAFANCNSLKSITLPESLRYIGECAFTQSGIKRIVIPASVERVIYSAIGGSWSVEAAAFNGKDTELENITDQFFMFTPITIYCQPQSKVKPAAESRGIPCKPLREFMSN
ncbi:MAG: leucine-rich repeat protein [Oscillospiraceae bacterium]